MKITLERSWDNGSFRCPRGNCGHMQNTWCQQFCADFRRFRRHWTAYNPYVSVFCIPYHKSHLYKKENFVGICAKSHPFANKTVLLKDTFSQDIVVREPFSGTRNLLQNAVQDRGFSLESYKRCTSVSNFSVICDLVVNNGAITFAYEPISHCRDDLSTFTVSDLQINGEFNFVYCNERVAKRKVELIFDEN